MGEAPPPRPLPCRTASALRLECRSPGNSSSCHGTVDGPRLWKCLVLLVCDSECNCAPRTVDGPHRGTPGDTLGASSWNK
eukprot:scaffold38730_cov53-Attheya_sp.AAC.1